MGRIDTVGNFCTDIADAIRSIKGTTEPIKASNFDTEIKGLSSGASKYAPRYISFYYYHGTELDEELNNLDGSNLTSAYSMFSNSTELTSIPLFDTSNVTDFGSMCTNCRALTTIPKFNTANATNFNNMFSGCSALISVPELDASKVTIIQSVVYNCTNLSDLGGFKNLGQAYLTSRAENYSQYKLDLSACSKLTYDSLMNVINNLYDIKTKGCKNQSLVLGATNLAKLTADEIAIATNKGWNVT